LLDRVDHGSGQLDSDREVFDLENWFHRGTHD
jgi:hypothetical protein